ncbi:MAG TPA: hypothetical protein V6C78_03175 [Crinalium sp.]|jgi:hypothetical protein
MKLYSLSISFATAILLLGSAPLSEARSLAWNVKTNDTIAQVATNSDPFRVPSIIDQGFAAYRTGDLRGAIAIWSRNSPGYLQNQSPVFIGSMEELLQSAGDYLGYSVIYSHSVTENTQVIYLESQHQHGTFFWRFIVSNTQGISAVTDFELNSDPAEILPQFVMYQD